MFEAQAEWTSLLWWLVNHQQGALRAGTNNVGYRQYGASTPWTHAPVFPAVIGELVGRVRLLDWGRFTELLGTVADLHCQWVKSLSPTGSWRDRAAMGRVPQGSFYNPRALVASAEAHAVQNPNDDVQLGRIAALENNNQIHSLWAAVAINALTVHVVNRQKVNVLIPVNRELCQVIHGDGERASVELHKMGRLLAIEAVATHNSMAYMSGASHLKYGLERHKQRHHVQRSEMELEMVQYSSTRLAWVGVDDRGSYMLDLHEEDRLQRQHPHQVVFLGQCGSFLAASALIKAATVVLRVSYCRSRVRFWAGVDTEMMATWDGSCAQVGLGSGPERRTIRQSFPENPNDDLRIMLRRTATQLTDIGLEPFLREVGL